MANKPSLSSFIEDTRVAGYFPKGEIQINTKFNRYGYFNPYDTLTSKREYIFFTKPDLNLLDTSGYSLNSEIADEVFFRECLVRYRSIMLQLQKSANGHNSPFINILSNTVRSELELPSINATDIENSSTIYGDNITYRWSSEASDNNHEFSLEFEDDKYLQVYMLFKIWDIYNRLKSLGAISPPNTDYIFNRILHDQCSVYKFIVGEDGESIIYYAKLWGVYPKTVPRDTFSSLNLDNGIKHSVSFNATFVEDMNPIILKEFNNLVGNRGQYDLQVYSGRTGSGRINNVWSSCPRVQMVTNYNAGGDNRVFHKLKWRN